MIIRKAIASDVDQIVSIEKESFESPWSRTSIIEEFSRPDTETFTAFSEDVASGYCFVRFGIDEAELFKIAVSINSRRKGIARALYLEAEQICIKSGKTRIFLEVDEINTSAISLYESVGFVEISRRKNYYGNRSAIIMLKSL